MKAYTQVVEVAIRGESRDTLQSICGLTGLGGG